MMEDNERLPILLLTATGLGALAALLGAGTSIGYGDHLLGLGEIGRTEGPAASSVAYVGGNGLLVVAETFACAIFLTLTVMILFVRHHRAARVIAILVAVAKTIWLVASVASHWKPGWYFILDPVGEHTTARLLFFASIAQALALMGAAVVLVLPRNPTARSSSRITRSPGGPDPDAA